MSLQPNYLIYPTLLDSFQNYLRSDEIYDTYFGSSENPKYTLEEFEQKSFQDLIDRINRIPFESEAADKGTAFNEVIDCLIENRKPRADMEFHSDRKRGVIVAKFKGYTFEFPLRICLEMRDYLKGALTQVRVSAPLATKYGLVELYGFADELLPMKVVDIKTTSRYYAFKFKNNMQHLVYPYCLIESGDLVNEFEYYVTNFKDIWSEVYVFDYERDVPILIEVVEGFIEFIEENRALISNKRLFNE